MLAGDAALRRNYQDLTFCPQDKQDDLKESRRRTIQAIRQSQADFRVFEPETASREEMLGLVEKGMLPASFDKLTEVALAADEKGTSSVAINTGEHLLIRCADQEGDLEGLVGKARALEASLRQEEHPFAYNSRFGYLSFNPVLAGSGLYVSMVIHLPMLSFLKQIRPMMDVLKERHQCQLKALETAEGRNPGNLFLLGNLTSFDLSDKDIVQKVQEAARMIEEKENILRHKAFHEARVSPLLDQAWRAYGTLRYTRRLTTADFLSLWSKLRLGALADILPVPVPLTNQLLSLSGDSRYLTQGTLLKACPFRRADEVRQALSGG